MQITSFRWLCLQNSPRLVQHCGPDCMITQRIVDRLLARMLDLENERSEVRAPNVVRFFENFLEIKNTFLLSVQSDETPDLFSAETVVRDLFVSFAIVLSWWRHDPFFLAAPGSEPILGRSVSFHERTLWKSDQETGRETAIIAKDERIVATYRVEIGKDLRFSPFVTMPTQPWQSGHADASSEFSLWRNFQFVYKISFFKHSELKQLDRERISKFVFTDTQRRDCLIYFILTLNFNATTR